MTQLGVPITQDLACISNGSYQQSSRVGSSEVGMAWVMVTSNSMEILFMAPIRNEHVRKFGQQFKKCKPK